MNTIETIKQRHKDDAELQKLLSAIQTDRAVYDLGYNDGRRSALPNDSRGHYKYSK